MQTVEKALTKATSGMPPAQRIVFTLVFALSAITAQMVFLSGLAIWLDAGTIQSLFQVVFDKAFDALLILLPCLAMMMGIYLSPSPSQA